MNHKSSLFNSLLDSQQRNYEISALLALWEGIHPSTAPSPRRQGPVMHKSFPCHDTIMWFEWWYILCQRIMISHLIPLSILLFTYNSRHTDSATEAELSRGPRWLATLTAKCLHYFLTYCHTLPPEDHLINSMVYYKKSRSRIYITAGSWIRWPMQSIMGENVEHISRLWKQW